MKTQEQVTKPEVKPDPFTFQCAPVPSLGLKFGLEYLEADEREFVGGGRAINLK